MSPDCVGSWPARKPTEETPMRFVEFVAVPVRLAAIHFKDVRALPALAALLVAMLLSACGSGDRSGSTTCGVQTCQAGQYCLNLACVPGCLSNQNCASDQVCGGLEDGKPVGTCMNKGADAPDMSMAPVITDPVCKKMFDKLVQCGLFTWDEGVAAQSLCGKLTAQQLKTMSDCATAWDCSGTTAPVCLGSLCGGKYMCAPFAGMNLRCVSHACVP